MKKISIKKIKSEISYFIARNRHFFLFSRLAGFAKSYLRIYENNNYKINSNGELRVMRLMQSLRRPVVFDVGANIGEWSIAFASENPSSTIFSFEPIQKTYHQLRENTKEYASIATFNIGLSNVEANLFMYFDLEKSVLSSLLQPQPSNQNITSEECKFTTGDTFCKKYGIDTIDFLKVDVEGAEGRVLHGFSEWLRLGKIRIIQFEYNTLSIQSKYLLYDFYHELLPLGFQIGKIYPNSVDFRPYHTSMEDFIGLNFLAVYESVAKDWIAKLKG